MKKESFMNRLLNPYDTSIELHDFLGILVIVVFLGLAIHNSIHGNVDLMGFGTGVASILGSMAGCGWMRGQQRSVDPANPMNQINVIETQQIQQPNVIAGLPPQQGTVQVDNPG